MIHPNDQDFYKALRILKSSEGYELKIKPWLKENIKSLKQEIHSTTEPMALNRSLGAFETFSDLLDEIENSPENEEAFAKGENSREIGSIPV